MINEFIKFTKQGIVFESKKKSVWCSHQDDPIELEYKRKDLFNFMKKNQDYTLEECSQFLKVMCQDIVEVDGFEVIFEEVE